ncbi:MAG: AAA family ATPase [Candidatus Dormiibacterota bacterium]
MRLKTLVISGFRGFAARKEFDLDGDAIIIAGPNGSGKTSMFDALLWGLTGSVPRIHEDQAQLVSKYSLTGEARVEIVLHDVDGADLHIVRRFDGMASLSVSLGSGTEMTGPEAEAALLMALWPDSTTAADPMAALTQSLTRAAYLQQDLVRQFVESDDEQSRFQVVSELIGIGRVEELRQQLDRSRNNWSRATNMLEREEVEPLRAVLQTVRERLARLSHADATEGERDAFREWTLAARVYLADDETATLESGSAQALDRALRALQSLQLVEERKLAALQRLLRYLGQPAPLVHDIALLEAAVHAAEAVVQTATEALTQAQQEAALVRQRQVANADRAEARRTLAQLALLHLGARCPICDQEYDRERTVGRLQEMAREGATEDTKPSIAGSLSTAVDQLTLAEQELTRAQAELRSGLVSVDNRRTWEAAVTTAATEAGLDVADGLAEAAEQRVAASQARAEALRNLRESGERFSVYLAQAAELAQRDQLLLQRDAFLRDLAVGEADVRRRAHAGELASRVLESLRDANELMVSAELKRIEPLLQTIYAKVDPHPSFRVVNFLIRTSGGRGRLWTAIRDPSTEISVDEPAVVLSSSQLNVLAVSTFLSLNLAIPTLPLQVVALDDPLQSLDSVNLLGLTDVLRRVTSSRQVIVSAHDERLAGLLERKLRPVEEGRQTRIIRFEAWTREGPHVEQSLVNPDVPPLRLVAVA